VMEDAPLRRRWYSSAEVPSSCQPPEPVVIVQRFV
jgi:hypothetical protein